MTMLNVSAIATKPKIFLVIQSRSAWAPDVSGVAIAEDGTLLAAIISSSDAFLEADLRRKTANFEEKYPQGYELLWMGDLPATDEDFREALRRYVARNRSRCAI